MSADLAAQIRAYNQWTPRDLVQEYGSITPLAQQLAGVPASDKSSKEYKAARRNVERYLKGGKTGRKPSKATVERLQQIGSQFKKPPPDKIKLNGKILVGTSPDKARDRAISIPLHMDEEEWDRLSELAEEDNEEEAWEELADIYQVDHLEMISGSISIA